MNIGKKGFLAAAVLLMLGVGQSTSAAEAEYGYAVTLKSDALMLMDAEAMEQFEYIPQLSEYCFADSLEDVEKYIGMENVERVEMVEPLHLFDLPDDTLYDSQWNYTKMRAEYARLAEVRGEDIRVAVIDSGIITDHEDFVGADILPGKNFSQNSETNKTEPDDMADGQGHGTAVAGVIAAQTDNGKGVCGIAPSATIVPLRCFNAVGRGSDKMAAEAIYAAVDEYDCDVINMSFGVAKSNTYFEEAIRYAYEKGVIIVAAVGNSGGTDLYYPAAYDEVVGVGMIMEDETCASKSQHNESVFVTAPGYNILTLNYQDPTAYGTKAGTSFAAPCVSALAALMLDADPDMTPAEFMNILKTTSKDLGEEGYDIYYGNGLIDTEQALKKLDVSLKAEMEEAEEGTTVISGHIDGCLPQGEMKIALAAYDRYGRMLGFRMTECMADKIGVIDMKEEMQVHYKDVAKVKAFRMKEDGCYVPYNTAVSVVKKK